MTAAGIAAEVRSGQTPARGVVEAALSRIAARDPELNAFTAVFADQARVDADAVDAAVAAGRDPGPLAGVPFAVKNLFDIEGVTTLAGAIIEAGNPPATADAAAVASLKAAGAILVGALNMDEYAYGFTTENSHYGATRNPHDPSRIAGGSSGGSAAAVAAELVPLTLGSDTNGSIRVPAALCGIYGLKPTFSRLSRRGVFPFVHSLDHVGGFARSVEDLALMYDALQGADLADPACAGRAIEPVSGIAAGPVRAGRLAGWFEANLTDEAAYAVDVVSTALKAEAGVVFAGAEAARAAAFCLTGAEGGSLHMQNLKTRPNDFDPATRDRLIAGALQPAHVLAKAQRVRRLVMAEALALFERFDVLVAPATPFPATPIGQATTVMGGETVSVRANLGLYTQPISFLGLPVLTAPVARPGRMPVGVQLIAAPWREDLLFRAAAFLQREGVTGPTPASEAALAYQ